MTTLLEAFGRVHRLGSHCSSSVLRDLFRFYGHDFSEDLCFGLGSGLGFIYVRHQHLCIFGGRAGGLERQMCQCLGVRFATYQSDDDDLAWEQVRALVDRGIPVVCDVDMTHLPYLRSRIQVTADFRFGGHKVVVAGYEGDTVYVYDYLWQEPQTVQVDDFKRARGSQIQPDPPENTWFTFQFPARLVDLKIAVRQAIAYNVHQMLFPVAFGLGLRALERFCKEFPRWPAVMSEERLRREVYIAHMSFEKIGTGGGNFRRLYARFLREAGRILNLPALEAEISPLYFELARLWKRFAEELQTYRPSLFTDPAVSGLLGEIAAKEREAVMRLRTRVGR
jgi:hypothetical protein